MKDIVSTYVEQHTAARNRRQRWLNVVAVLVAIVVFFTTYVLIIPAFSWDRTLICEQEEHIHSDACYTDGELTCDKVEHVHADACFDAPPAEDEGYICGEIEHTHNELCYFPDGELRCTLPEHTHTDACLEATVKSFAAEEVSQPAGMMLLSATPQTSTYYQRVNKIDSTTANYLIITVEGNYALVAGDAGATSATGQQVKLVPVKGNPGYYTISNVTDSMRWQFGSTLSSNGGTTTIRRGSNGVYLYQTRTGNSGSYRYPLFSSSSGQEELEYNATSGVWTIRGTARNATTYYLYTDGSSITSSGSTNYTYNRNLLILKQVYETLDIPDDVTSGGDPGGGSGTEKTRPTYSPDAESISGKKTGEITDISSVIGGESGPITGSYASDAATSNVEDQFFGVSQNGKLPLINDGKVVSDKSVVYEGDDYNAFSSYADGTFGITLSTLGQDYQLKQEDQVKVPVDVVFVLDASGSMSNQAGDVTRREAVVNSVNTAMSQIMTDNPANRAGVVLYSSGGSTLLELDHYTPNRPGNYLRYDSDSKDIYTANNLSGDKVGPVTSTNGERNGFTQAHGTYTQYGIALGAKLLQDNTDTTYTATLYKGTEYEKKVTVKRQPVIILLSDGDPTHCTSNYTDVLNGPAYGSGAYPSTTNNKGVQGYYTILSANYYKRAVAIHYDYPAIFYTIGMGINTTSYSDMSGASSTGDGYKRAVLNPSSTNINNLLSNEAKNTDPNSRYSASETWSISCEMLNSLLKGSYGQSYVTVDTTQSYSAAIGVTNRNVPILENPYSNYNYADGAYFGNLSTEDLEKVFGEIISSSISVKNYGYMLFKGTSVIVTDEIGEGMEIKGTPVLRYNGVNYRLTKGSTSGNTVTYVCNATATTTDGSGINGTQRTADLREIEVKVTTKDGKQTVTMEVPETVLPSYTPELTADWYYEELPVRLIYQVGLNDAAKTQISEMKAGQSLTFYTNTWGDTSAGAVQSPHADNPYYNDVTYDNGTSRKKQYVDGSVKKTENTSGTAENSVVMHEEFLAGSSFGNDDVIMSDFGNNGKLVFTNEGPTTVSLVLEKQDMLGKTILDNPAYFDLYTDAELKQKFGSYQTGKDGTLTMTGLDIDVVYYLVESRAPDGFNRMPVIKTFKMNADGTAVDIDPGDTYISFADGKLIVKNPTGYMLPSTGGIGTDSVAIIGVLLIAIALTVGYTGWKKAKKKR